MKHFLLINVLSFLLTGNVFGQSEKPLLYKIEIENWGLLLGPNTTWMISKDSISVRRQNLNGTVEIFTTVLSTKEKDSIQTSLLKVDLNKLNRENVDNSAPDDMGEFDFKLTVGKATKEFQIYQVYLDSIFNLVKQINIFLPNKYDIGYNAEYFRFKK
ncbi:MAG: hypothetical protein EOO46_20985 [Flavobacterium sp.]|nr:MAG: hypothetical protein EOO46_20985 [Flavobacterium sp.]